jgi:hypothetical protein
MPEQQPRRDTAGEDIFDEAREVVEDSRQLADDVEEFYERVADVGSLKELYDRNPYAVLAAAAGTGYVLGGGLFTSFTKRLGRLGMKALVIPVALSKLREATQPALEDEPDPPSEAP